MSDSPYVPVSCALHSELELAALRRRPITLRLRDGSSRRGTIADVWTEGGREWLRLHGAGAEEILDLTMVERVDAVEN